MYRKLIFIGFGALFLIMAPLLGQCYELYWSEEFNYTGFPDEDTWTFETGAGGWGNNELQYYKANDPDNAWVEDGRLTITAINESYDGSDYTSSRLITRDKFEFQYGKIEGRLKLPYSQGIWPAFWLLGENIYSVGWPACGEIDIMELVGGEDSDHVIYGTGHWDNNGSHAMYGGSIALDSGIYADTFHIFSVEWTPQKITWFMDGKQFHALNITDPGLSEFHHNFFMILNIAVGGNWPGYPDTTSVFPQTMEVDYIRVYKSDVTPEIAGDTLVAERSMNNRYSVPYFEIWDYLWSLPDDAEIISGQGTEQITVNWGCAEGEVQCSLTGICKTYELSLPVAIENKIHGPMFIEENQTGICFYTAKMAETSYNWSVPDDAVIVEGQGTDSILVNWGEEFSWVSLTIENSCGTKTFDSDVFQKGQYPYPDPYLPHSIPGVWNATEYDYGGEGIAYHDLSSRNQGPGPRQDEGVDTDYNDDGNPIVKMIYSGEWLKYSVNVESAGSYRFMFHVATNSISGGPFSIELNDVEVLNGITVSNTGGWNSFTTIDAGKAFLTESDTVMKIDFNTGGFNLGAITITSTVSDEHGRNIPTLGFELYPNPASGMVSILSGEIPGTIHVTDLFGRQIITKIFPGKNHSCTLDVSNFDNGIYLVIMESDNGERSICKLSVSD
ncbi:MAG: family 16 glycosylhydrolase [Bacteroidales bacterium]|nr:family 16 glycosylhydrolase [Bacteroidales bacterium]MBN2699753.1 family 16 glycosylhydrolase [Bacteroidales bacterium]